MKALKLLIHCLFTTAITGGFFFFQIIDFFLVSDTKNGNDRRLGDSILLIIFSLPYLYDAYTGITNYRFLYKVSQLNKEKNSYERAREDLEMSELDKVEVSEMDDHVKQERLCIICCVEEKNAVIDPCGHMLCCVHCAQVIMSKKSLYSVPRCPICRSDIQSYIRLIEA